MHHRVQHCEDTPQAMIQSDVLGVDLKHFSWTGKQLQREQLCTPAIVS